MLFSLSFLWLQLKHHIIWNSEPIIYLFINNMFFHFGLAWHGRYVQSIKSLEFNCGGTKRFLVFREEDDMNMCYTEDIGDLCIFLGDNEPFVVKASLFPGLNPNSIYFVGEGYGEGYGVYNIATRTPRSFKPKPTTSPSGQAGFMVRLWVPHWLPPFPL